MYARLFPTIHQYNYTHTDYVLNHNPSRHNSYYNEGMPTGATIVLAVGFGLLIIIIGIAVVFYCATCMAWMSKKNQIHVTGSAATVTAAESSSVEMSRV